MEMKGKVNHVWELFLKFVFIKDGFSMSGDMACSVICVTYDQVTNYLDMVIFF